MRDSSFPLYLAEGIPQISRMLQDDGDANIMNSNATTTVATAAPSEAPTYLEQVYRSQGLFVTAMTLGSLAVLMSLVSMMFIYRYRKKQVVAVAQPPFLLLMCLGTLLLSVTIYFYGLDEETTASDVTTSDQLSAMCTADTWIWHIGLLLVYCSLFSKLLRVHKVTRFRRGQRILPKHVIGPFVLLMVATVSVLIAYTIVDPPVWERDVFVYYDDDYWDDYLPGETRVYGYCLYSFGWEDALTALLVVSCLLCLVMACRVRNVPEEISDGRRIFQSILARIIIAAIGFSVGYIIGGDNGTIGLVVGMEIAVSFAWVLSLLGFLIVPKMYYVWYEWKYGHLPQRIRNIGGGRVEVSGIHSSNIATSMNTESALKFSQAGTMSQEIASQGAPIVENERIEESGHMQDDLNPPEMAIQAATTDDSEPSTNDENDEETNTNAKSPASSKRSGLSAKTITMTTLLAIALCIATVDASAVPDPHPYCKTSSVFAPRSRRSIISHDNVFLGSNNPYKRTMLVSSKTKTRQQQLEEKYPELSFRDLGPVGKMVAGVTEIVFATLFEYCSGFMTGIFFGTLVGIPGFAFRPMEKGMRQPFVQEVKKRFSRMNTRSVSWAKSFGSISAAFGGFGVAVKVIRNGEEDVWNSILSSAAAGAFFARKEGPEAMVRGALLYGGLIYLVNGGGFGGSRKQLQEYTEKPVPQSF